MPWSMVAEISNPMTSPTVRNIVGQSSSFVGAPVVIAVDGVSAHCSELMSALLHVGFRADVGDVFTLTCWRQFRSSCRLCLQIALLGHCAGRL